MPKKPDLSLVLTCYNEAEHFTSSGARIVSALKKLRRPFEIIFVEDKSTDNTAALIKQFVRAHKAAPIRTIFHPTNRGRGASVRDGIAAARGTYVGFVDIDLEIDTVYLPQFIEALDAGFDVACAVRKYSLSLANVPRWVVSLGYRVLMRAVLGVPLADTEAGYKFFNRRAVLPILTYTRHNHWFWDTEIMVMSFVKGLRISEIPVLFIRRNDKTSTVKLIPDSLDYAYNLFRFRSQLPNRDTRQKNIDTYWQQTPSLFSRAYSVISPTSFFLRRRKHKISRILGNLSGKTVLDVGCGDGVFMELALDKGCKRAVGVDYSQQMLNLARGRLEPFSDTQYKLVKANAAKIPVRQTFDIVLASGLTDYLLMEENERFVAEVARLLKKGGMFVITFPKKKSPFALLRRGAGLWFRKNFLQLPPMSSSFTKTDIISLLKGHGLVVEDFDDVFATMWIAVGRRQ